MPPPRRTARPAGASPSLLLPLLLPLFLVGVAGCATAPAAELPSPFDSQGHRGARGLLPENTVAGARRALELGMRTVELDLAVSRDSVLVVSHEPTFNPAICSLDGTGYDAETSLFGLTAAEIDRVDCGSLPNPDFPYQESAPGGKPTFRSFVAAADAHAVALDREPPRYNVEIKTHTELDGAYTPSPQTFAMLVSGALGRLGIRDRTTVQSFDPRPLAWFAHNAPDVPLAGLVAVAYSRADFTDRFADGVDVFSPHHLTLTRGTVADYHAGGVRVVPWTVNDKSRMRTLIRWGVDGVITDYPDRLAEVMAEF